MNHDITEGGISGNFESNSKIFGIEKNLNNVANIRRQEVKEDKKKVIIVLEIKCKKTFFKSNFTRRVLARIIILYV